MHKITACRVCGGQNLLPVLNLGRQKLTGVFPPHRRAEVTEGPLELVWCPTDNLLQLHHSYDPREMYGANYGYRSGLNRSMVRHLSQKVRRLEARRPLSHGDSVVDIGSNDATLLRAYHSPGIRRLGVDPTGEKFRPYYSDGIDLIADFFSKSVVTASYGKLNAAIITSIAMFYDLESPIGFVRDIAEILAIDGIWHFEQSYMPSMLRMNSYDTICHEHLEYYSLHAIRAILDKCDLRIIDVQMNSVNGGSFAVTACHAEAPFETDRTVIEWLLEQEERMELSTPKPFREFEGRVFEHRRSLKRLISELNANGKTIFGYGASTKGNVLLQFCGLSEKEIPVIAEVNADKFGCYTPGTEIPIIPEEEARARRPDYFLVLPWHFRDAIIAREEEYLAAGGRMIFPLPEIEIIGG